MERDWRARNVGVMQGGGASQEVSAETLASATCTMINTLPCNARLQVIGEDPRLPQHAFSAFGGKVEIAVSLIAKPAAAAKRSMSVTANY